MSTLYDISLRITYTYENPARFSRTLLRMMPRSLPQQQMIFGFVGTNPLPGFRRDGVDFFGNPTTEVAHDGGVKEMTLRFDGRIRRSGAPMAMDLSCRLSHLASEIAAFRSIAPDAPHHFLGDSDRVHHEPEIAAYARELLSPGMSVLEAVQTVSGALHRDMVFDAVATEVSTPAIDAFRNGRGVCQDFSHILITALRAVGIPAGYVSGFLRTKPPEGKARLEGADAMHAWVQAWCGSETGWVQIDPTNDMLVGSDHIVVALGRDYSDVSPVRGALRAAGRQSTRQNVDVVPVA